ncbi:MAG: beta-glucosidase [Hydrocarboniphaga sp.]|uniref:glycoside hydrolase family 3 N-terminal domain-containing protein n=1 Tax=Hydrocarboniphaga sp. TaxID=2033016 RepID=UPI00260EDE1B|nr:glycoside hydrolase family 3 N-terminal domain-containing protein [Hydrocarboniphaga sp.]MDB5969780.1 beta-glucosidase [Hydrocarboniphaga sp.]
MAKPRKNRGLVAALLLCAAPLASAFDDTQIEALITKMTPEEKAGQLTLVAAVYEHEPSDNERQPGEPTAMQRQLNEIREGRISAVFNGIGANWARQLQRAAVEQSRLKIPVLISVDAIHGFHTIYPVPLAEAASWDPALAERVARATAVEATAAGVAWNLAPNVDIARDARWGRGVEGAGEDVLLASRFAAARVRGYQKGGRLADDDAMMATPKHFAGYGGAEGGLDYNVVDISERTLREVYLPPFKAAFDAGAGAVMAGFHEIGGIPAMANSALLDGVLRREWQYPGLVISDYAADHELVEHGVAADDRAAVKLAFMAGVDMSMTSRLYQQYLPELVASGDVPMTRLDQAVRRVLRAKRNLGLFDRPYGRMDTAREKRFSHTADMRALARESATRAIVMLKNDHDLLPLPRTGKRLALIGPLAGGPADLNGPWTVFDDRHDAVSVEAGLRAAIADPTLLSVTRGSDIDAPLEGGIAAAVAAAAAADVVVLAIGEGEAMSGEAQSRTEIVIPAAQQALAEAVAATGKPLVVLLRTGRALALTGAVRDADATLVTWFLGAETGHAIADVLFGTVSPSGRLPVSFPQASGQVPYYYAHKSTGRPPPPGPLKEYTARYRELTAAPLYAFGHGLSYSTIEYSAPALSARTMPWNGRLKASATIRNTGPRAVDETAQLYVHDRVASVTRPVRELKNFLRVHLAPGESREVSFELSRADLEFIGTELKPVAEPGEFDLWIAPSAVDGSATQFTLMPPL